MGHCSWVYCLSSHSGQLSLLASMGWEMSTSQGAAQCSVARNVTIGLVVRHRLGGMSTYRLNGPKNGNEHHLQSFTYRLNGQKNDYEHPLPLPMGLNGQKNGYEHPLPLPMGLNGQKHGDKHPLPLPAKLCMLFSCALEAHSLTHLLTYLLSYLF